MNGSLLSVGMVRNSTSIHICEQSFFRHNCAAKRVDYERKNLPTRPFGCTKYGHVTPTRNHSAVHIDENHNPGS